MQQVGECVGLVGVVGLLEILLGRAAKGAFPVIRQVLKGGSRRNVVLRIADFGS